MPIIQNMGRTCEAKVKHRYEFLSAKVSTSESVSAREPSSQ